MILQEIVQTAASLYPNRRAVCFDECDNTNPVTYTYMTFIDRATELTGFLRKHCILSASLAFGLYCYPGIDLPSWIIGILQVPAAYSPIDPDALPVLSAYFMTKCNFQYVLVEEDKVEKFTETHGQLFCRHSSEAQKVGLILFQWHCDNVDANLLVDCTNGKNESCTVTRSWEEQPLNSLETKPSRELLNASQKHSLAYILHTSGTTGVPKIVRVPHTCIVPNILHLRDAFKIAPDDTVFMASPLTFDPSVVELFTALASGASVLIVPNLIKMKPRELCEALFQRHRVSVLQATPTLLRRFGTQRLKSTVLSANSSLRILALGGETIPGPNVLRSWKGKGNKTHLFNLYGITEVSCWATCYKIPEEVFSSDQFDSLVPLGTPLPGTTVEVRDVNGFAILEGEGQVFIGGKDRVCFIDGEVALPEGTMRATGDFVRVKDSEMFFLGRKDNQIKRHGKRLNIEYVQQMAEGCSQVETCAVIWYQQEKLVLFVVPKGSLKREELLKKLQERLPSHAVPDEILLIDSLPFTSHAKINVSELEKIYSSSLNSRERGSKLSKKEELWERLQCLWKSLLNLPEDPASISKDALFLPSGGDSLKSLQLHDEVKHMVGSPVPGLLEMILSRSISEVYQHILQTAFPHEDENLSSNISTKRKLSGSNRGEPSQKRLEPKHGSVLKPDMDRVAFIAVSRGSQWLSSEEFLKDENNTGQAEVQLRELTASSSLVTSDGKKSGDRLKSKHGETIASASDVIEMDSVHQIAMQDNLERRAEKLTLRVRWKSDLGKCVDASPLVVVPVTDESSASVYVGSHSHLIQAIDLYSGQVRWARDVGDRMESSACVSKCGQFIVVGCYNGLVYTLRSSNGEIHWTFVTEDVVKCSAVMDPSTGLIFIGSHDQHVYALDIYKRTCVWKFHSEAGAVFASPHLNLLPHHLYFATLGGMLIALNPIMGTILWKTCCGKPIFSSPHCSKDCVCVGCVDGNLYCFSHFGDKVWQFSTNGPIFSSPCISRFSGKVFFGSHDYFTYCCDMDGNLLWKFETTATVYATPFVFHGRDDLEDTVFLAVASTDGRVWILNAKTGSVEGTWKLPGEVFSSPVVWGTILIVGCRNNYVYCLDLCISANNQKA